MLACQEWEEVQTEAIKNTDFGHGRDLGSGIPSELLSSWVTLTELL